MSLCALCKRRYKPYNIILTNKVEAMLFDKYIRDLYYKDESDIGVCEKCRETELVNNNLFRWKAAIILQEKLKEMISKLDINNIEDKENIKKYEQAIKDLKEDELKYFGTPEVQEIVKEVIEEHSKNKMPPKKDYTVVIPKEIQKQIEEAGILDDFNNAVEKLQKGDFSDAEPVDFEPCEVLLKCAECNSDNTSWVIDKNSNEVYYNCHDCNKFKGFMYKHEYEKIIETNPDAVVKNGNK